MSALMAQLHLKFFDGNNAFGHHSFSFSLAACSFSSKASSTTSAEIVYADTYQTRSGNCYCFVWFRAFLFFNFCGRFLGVFFWNGCLFVWGLVLFLFLCLFIFIWFVWWGFGGDGGGVFLVLRLFSICLLQFPSPVEVWEERDWPADVGTIFYSS